MRQGVGALKFKRNDDGTWAVRTNLVGQDLLLCPLVNKGSAFSDEERSRLRLHGLMPRQVSSLEQQVERAYLATVRKADDLEKYIGLNALQDRNETLFYRLLLDHIEELMPIVYTPTVGQATQMYSRIVRHTRGVWITPDQRGQVADILRNAPRDDVRLIVVTDNERILGLGDQGAGGIGIPIGKLSIYTVAAGIHPSWTLPISLDVGTDNEALRNDPLYLGARRPRLRGPEYQGLVDEFVEAVKMVFPNALLQWEDFKKQNAFDLLDRHRDQLPSFNDDIEGTASVAVAGIMAAGRVTGRTLADERTLILGAGAAGVGIARLIHDALEEFGLDHAARTERVALVDSEGLLHVGREISDPYKRDLAWPKDLAVPIVEAGTSVESIVRAFRPTVLVGTTGQPGAFSQNIVEAMNEYVERPAIFPFSNPTANSEAKPVDLLRWTDGRALVATGSPFDPVEQGGRTFRIGQGNNAFVFPGIGLGVLASGAKSVLPSMFLVAAKTLAEAVRGDDLQAGLLYPPLARLREVTQQVAVAVATDAVNKGVARRIDASTSIASAVEKTMWYPAYPEIEGSD